MKITVDGCDYDVQAQDNDINVYDCNNDMVGHAYIDHETETVHFVYFDDDQTELDNFTGSSSDLYFNGNTVTNIAEWLVSTHPCNG